MKKPGRDEQQRSAVPGPSDAKQKKQSSFLSRFLGGVQRGLVADIEVALVNSAIEQKIDPFRLEDQDLVILEKAREFQKIAPVLPNVEAVKVLDLVGRYSETQQTVLAKVLEEAGLLRPEEASKIISAIAEKARITSKEAVIESPMGLSEEQKQAAQGGYVPPSRIGKKTIAGHFSEATARELKDLAHIRRTTVQSLLEEAIGDLFVKHAENIEQARAVFKKIEKT